MGEPKLSPFQDRVQNSPTGLVGFKLLVLHVRECLRGNFDQQSLHPVEFQFAFVVVQQNRVVGRLLKQRELLGQQLFDAREVFLRLMMAIFLFAAEIEIDELHMELVVDFFEVGHL